MLWASSELGVVSDGSPGKESKVERNYLPLKLILKDGEGLPGCLSQCATVDLGVVSSSLTLGVEIT